MNSAEILLILPELTLTIGGLVLLMVAAFAGDRVAELTNALAAMVLALALGLLLKGHVAAGPIFSGSIRIDAFANFAKILIYGAAIISLLLAPRFFARQGYRAEYPILILFAALGMSIMVSAHDLMTLYVGLELNSLAAYVLASMNRHDPRAAEAGLKYFVLGALASGILLFGMSLVYGFTGSTNFAGIALGFAGAGKIGVLMGVVFVLTGLAFKVSAVPFHMWTPDVYEGAPTPVTAFFASAPKVASVALLVRVCIEAFGSAMGDWQQIIAFLSMASMLWGAFGAIGQRNIKRLLAYSSIANVGFMLMGLAAGSAEGIAAVLSYLLVYVVMTLGSFLAVLQMRTADGEMVEDIASLGGLWHQRPALAMALAIFMFSLAGIPPLFGFWPKFLVFSAAIGVGLVPLAVVGAIASVIGAFYYLRVIKIMLFDPPSGVEFPVSGNWMERGVMGLAAAYVSIFGFILVGPLANATQYAASALL